MNTSKLWLREPKVEFGLKNQLNLPYTIVEDIPFENIDREYGKVHQARIDERVDKERVLQIALHINSGNPLPMPILQAVNPSKKVHPSKVTYFAWDGNHRCEGLDLSDVNPKLVTAYVVETHDPRMQDILPRICNTWEGRREDQDQVIVHAIYLIEKYKMGVQEVATLLSIPYALLVKECSRKRTCQEMKEANIDVSKLTSSAYDKLSPLLKQKTVLQSLVRLLSNNDVSATSTKGTQIIDDVKGKDTEATMMGEIGKWEKIFADSQAIAKKAGITKNIRAGNRTKFINNLATLRKFMEGISQTSQLQLDDESAKIALAHWAIIEKKINQLMKSS